MKEKLKCFVEAYAKLLESNINRSNLIKRFLSSTQMAIAIYPPDSKRQSRDEREKRKASKRKRGNDIFKGFHLAPIRGETIGIHHFHIQI